MDHVDLDSLGEMKGVGKSRQKGEERGRAPEAWVQQQHL